MTWRNRARRGGRRAWEFTRSSGVRVQRVVSQKAADARQAGAQLARKVIGAQLAAGLVSDRRGPLQRESPRDLMQRSAESVVLPDGDRAWREGYRDVAMDFVPSLAAPVAPEPERPSWPFAPAIGPEPDGPEAGS
jgi:hypothetical protein